MTEFTLPIGAITKPVSNTSGILQLPLTDSVSVFGGTITGGNAKEGEVFIHGSVSHCYITGTGADTKLYTYDEDLPQKINLYEIGNLDSPWVDAPTPLTYPGSIANGNV